VTAYWPAWIAAPALGAITVAYWIVLRRPLGVSGVLARFTRLREEAAFDRGNAVLAADAAALEAAMTAATSAAFGDGPAAPAPGDGAPEEAAAAPEGRTCAPTPRLSAHATFLGAIVAGGLLASLARGGFGAGLGDAFARHVAAGPASLGALAAGGALVGFGASLCGGCSAGHGLTGCARLMPGSLAATAAFFAAGAAASFLL
jgi:hypothetical protein